ncbi:MAG: hydrogenase maturation protease [Vulcanimicrobiaceae bacterium]
MSPRVLVAGIGNIFFGDDAFGPAVLARLAREPIAGTRCEDFGIRGMHLAYELLAGYEAVVLVDAVSRGGTPGTLSVIEPSEPIAAKEPDAHRMDLGSVFGFVRLLEGVPPPITIVGCEPERLDEGAELSATVARAVDTALPLVRRIAGELLARSEDRSWSRV